MGARILFIGEIVGKSGVFALKSSLPELKRQYSPDFIVANADSATGGAGLGVQHAVYLRKLGVDCLTLGESSYYKLDLMDFYPKAPWVLRPANLPYDNPGRGWRIYQSPAGKVGVAVLLGQAGFSRIHGENPFHALDYIVEKMGQETKTIILDFHAATTAEELTMAAYADGRVSAVVGSHTKVLTADERILPRGTAAISCSGRTGSILSVGGMDPEGRIKEFMTATRVWEGDSDQGLEVQGLILETGEGGRAVGVQRFRHPCKEIPHERIGNSQEYRK